MGGLSLYFRKNAPTWTPLQHKTIKPNPVGSLPNTQTLPDTTKNRSVFPQRAFN